MKTTGVYFTFTTLRVESVQQIYCQNEKPAASSIGFFVFFLLLILIKMKKQNDEEGEED